MSSVCLSGPSKKCLAAETVPWKREDTLTINGIHLVCIIEGKTDMLSVMTVPFRFFVIYFIDCSLRAQLFSDDPC
jgi:hypothetical protein